MKQQWNPELKFYSVLCLCTHFDPTSLKFYHCNNSLFFIQVKIWNLIYNSTVAIVTEGLNCNNKNFLVCNGNDDNGFPGDDAVLGDKIHFLGKFQEMTLESYSQENGQNKCVFKTKCEGCFYIIISVFNVQSQDSAKICDIHSSFP